VKPSDLKRLLQSQNAPPAAEIVGQLIAPPEAVEWLRKAGTIREYVSESLRSRLLEQRMDPKDMLAAGLTFPDEADTPPSDTLDQANHSRARSNRPAQKAWRNKPSSKDIETAMLVIAKDYPDGEHAPEAEVWDKLRERLGPSVSRKQARDALTKYAPQLKGQRGRHRAKSPD
jgi:hypothetical protein